MHGYIMRARHAVCGHKWLQWERVGMIPYVRLWMQFLMRIRIRVRQTELGCV